ncbi:MAG: TonB-dependent receptor [Spongiibacteraceae bacterium]
MSIHARLSSSGVVALILMYSTPIQLLHAQTPNTNPLGSTNSAQTTELKAVVVNGAEAALNQSSAAKVIVSQEDLTRFGDTTIADALKRVPGISVSGTPGRGGEIRMRGLGNGYTQILLNGEPVAPGFSLDSLAPNLIERIEVVRSATADQSAQAIAGTINIILKKSVRQRQRTIKLAAASENDQPAFNLDLQQVDKQDTFSYSVAGNLKSQKTHSVGRTEQRNIATTREAISLKQKSTEERSEAYTASLTPRVSWQLDAHSNLIADGFISYQRGNVGYTDDVTFPIGLPSLYGDFDFSQDFYSLIARAGLSFSRELDDAKTVETKFSLNGNRRGNRNRRESLLPEQNFADDEPSLQRTVRASAEDSGAALSGKYRMPFSDKHALAFGWDSEISHRVEDRIQRDHVALVAPPENIDEYYSADVYRIAVFTQADWEITKRLSVYTGLRWEGLRTQSGGDALETVKNQSGVWSPSLQALWKIPDTKKDQIRVGIARTYKAPNTRNLIARRFRVDDNSPTTPDSAGNPDLRPELAWGLDVGYEHYFLGTALLNTSVYARQIKNVIQQELIFADDGRWVLRPVNNGRAQTLGFEVELKSALKELDKNLPAIDVRTNLSRNWSSVDNIPGPNNRLENQEKLNANFGADWKLSALPLTLGGNFGFKQGALVRNAVDRQSSTGYQRSLEAYALWKMNKSSQLRFSAANLLHQDMIKEDEYFYAGGTIDQTSIYKTYPVFRLALEASL